MTDDIIPRLRFRADYADYPSDAEAFNNAADEITRLRAELAAAKTRADAAEDWMAAQMSAYTSIEAERDALRALLREARVIFAEVTRALSWSEEGPRLVDAADMLARIDTALNKGGGDE